MAVTSHWSNQVEQNVCLIGLLEHLNFAEWPYFLYSITDLILLKLDP